MKNVSRTQLALIAALMLPFLPAAFAAAPRAGEWEDFPIVRTIEEAKALPADATAVSVRAGSAFTRQVLELLVQRGNIQKVHLLYTTAWSAEPLKDMQRLYSLSVQASSTTKLFSVVAELQDLRSFHLSVY